MTKLALVAISAILALLASGCQSGPSDRVAIDERPDAATLTGRVLYRERIALPPNAMVVVRLEDVSRADAAAVVLAEQVISTAGRQVPIPFSLPYDPSSIDPRFSYAVRATITAADGQLLWITDTRHPVLTRGAPSNRVEVIVRRATSGF